MPTHPPEGTSSFIETHRGLGSWIGLSDAELERRAAALESRGQLTHEQAGRLWSYREHLRVRRTRRTEHRSDEMIDVRNATIAEIRSRANELWNYGTLTGPQADELRSCESAIEEHDRQGRRAQLARATGIDPEAFARAERTGEPVRLPEGHELAPGTYERHVPASVGGDTTPAPRRGRERHAEARRILDRSDLLDDAAKDLVARTVEADPTPGTAELVAATSSPTYARAFAKVLADPANGHRSFLTEELHAWQRAEQVRSVNLTTGDALVPTHLDPSVMLDSAGVLDPVREVARVVQLTVGGTWHGVSSAGVTSEWLAEEAEAADASPSFDPPEVPTHKAAAWIEASQEALQDAAAFQAQLGAILADSKAAHEGPAWITGTGVNQPTGVVSGLTATETVTTVGAGAFAAEDVYALLEGLPARFRARATWLAALGILNAIDQFETTNGSKMFPELGNERLLRKPVREASEVSETIATGEHIAVVGDFANYVIADRLGASVELVPHLMGANRRPTGKRGFWYHWRVGGAPVVANAFRRLEVG